MIIGFTPWIYCSCRSREPFVATIGAFVKGRAGLNLDDDLCRCAGRAQPPRGDSALARIRRQNLPSGLADLLVDEIDLLAGRESEYLAEFVRPQQSCRFVDHVLVARVERFRTGLACS